jgi:RecB family exonuclease
MFGEKSSIRVTDIDAYRICPRKFFIEKVLSLKPLEIRKFEMEALVLGTIAHEIMQELLSEPFADLDTLVLNAGKRIDALLSRRPLEDYWKKVIKDTFMSILPVIYELERKIADEGYTFMRAEVPVKGEVLKGITLKGKIDRIDNKIMSEELKDTSGDKNISLNYHVSSFGTPVVELIDYKTGATQFSGSQVLSQGVNLQLILYAALMNLTGVLVERVGIYSLRDLSLSWIPNRNDRKNGRTLEDYRKAGLRFLEETVIRMRKGEFPALPLIEQICRNCPERPYCPYIQKSVMR